MLQLDRLGEIWSLYFPPPRDPLYSIPEISVQCTNVFSFSAKNKTVWHYINVQIINTFEPKGYDKLRHAVK